MPVATQAVVPDHVLGDDEDIADVLCRLFAPSLADAQAEYDCRAKFWNETKDVPDVKGEVVVDCGEGPWCDCIDTVGPFRVGAIAYRPSGGLLSNQFEVHAYCSHREKVNGRLLVSFQCE